MAPLPSIVTRPGLQTRLVMAFLVVAVVPLLLHHGLQARRLEREGVERAEALVDRVVLAQARLLDQEIERLDDQLRMIASRTQLRLSLEDHARTGSPAAVRLIERILRDAMDPGGDVDGIWVRDRRGALVTGVRRGDESASVADLPAPDAPRTLFAIDAAGPRTIWLSAPLRLDEQTIGVVHVQAAPGKIETLLTTLRDPAIGVDTAFLVRGTGGGFVPWCARDALPRGLRRGLVEDPPSVALASFRVTDGLYAVRSLRTVDARVVASVSLATVRASIREQRRLLQANLIVLILLATFMAVLVARRISAPVHSLLDATVRLRRGEHDVRVPEASWGEFEELNRAFNVAARRLERSRTTLERRVEEGRRVQRELVDRANTDPLTGLLNRRAFGEGLARSLPARRGDGPAGTLLYLDLDRFKPVNDRFGHDVGDETLCVVARRLDRLVRARDRIARIGGDEFAVLLEGIVAPDEVEGLVRRIRSALSRPMMVQHHRIEIGCSIGHAPVTYGRSVHDLLVEADAAMYRDKQSRRRRARAAEA